MKKKILSSLLLIFLLSISLTFALDDIFDEYGVREDIIETVPLENVVEFELKEDVVIDKEWMVKFNKEIQLDEICVMSIKKGNEYISVIINKIAQKQVKITPVNNYNYNTNYSLIIELMNGKYYRMNFITELLEIPGFTVGLVTDSGGIDDKSFNQSTWEGIERFAEDEDVEAKYLQSASDADYIPNLSAFSDEELDIIIAPGFLFADAMFEVAGNFPDQKYLIVDMVVGDRANVANAVFAEHEGSFLTGVAAALKADEAGKDTVGFIGGMDFDLIQKFEAGFEVGVAEVNPDMTVLIEYAGSFSDTQIGQTLAAKMFDQGAYIIYHAAGGTGNGLIKEAKDRRTNGEDVWAIGVDKDQYADGIYDGDNSAVLTSMMKRVDVAAYDVAAKTLAGEFPGGEVLVYSLANDGVGIPAENPNLSDEIINTVNEYKGKVISGEIEVPVLPNRLK